MSLRDDLEKVGGSAYLDRIVRPEAYDAEYLHNQAKLMMPTDPWADLAERFMEGLKSQAEQLSKGLQDNQQVVMFCYQGPEKLLVRSISMPSANVVSMRCLDTDGRDIYVTGHMHAVTFSFVIDTLVPPAVRTPIGFNMPVGEE